MKLIYIAGPLFGPHDWAIRRNIHHAVSLGYAVAELGAYPVIPHANTGAWFVRTITPEFWYAGTLELLRRCDAVVLVTGWQDSKGTVAEVEEARRLSMPVFERVEELKAWLPSERCVCLYYQKQQGLGTGNLCTCRHVESVHENNIGNCRGWVG